MREISLTTETEKNWMDQISVEGGAGVLALADSQSERNTTMN